MNPDVKTKSATTKSISINKAYLTYFIFLIFSFFPIIRLFTHVYLKGDSNVFTDNIHAYKDYFSLSTEDRLGDSSSTRLWLLFPVGFLYHIIDFFGGRGNIMQAAYIGLCFFIGMVSFAYLCRTLLGLSIHSLPVVIASIFYMYNPLVAQTLGGPFQFLIAYSLLPLFFAMFIKHLKQPSGLKLLIMGLVLSFIFGPNFVFGVVALSLCAVYLIFMHLGNIKIMWRGLWGLAVTALLALLLASWWLVPLLAVAFLDGGAAGDVLSSETFYNRDTSVVNVIRGLGDWSFFAKNLGQPYFSYAHSYIDNLLVVLGTLVPLALLIYLTMVKSSKRYYRIVGFFIALLLLTFIIVGGTHPDWITAKTVAYLFKSFPPLLIFRNTYKFAEIITLTFSLIAALAIYMLTQGRFKRLVYLVIPLLMIPSFPILFNLAMQDYDLVRNIPSYWQDAKKDMNSRSDVKRVLMLPDQYFSVYKWNGETANLGGEFESAMFDAQVVQDTCVGCARADSFALSKRLVQNYSKPTFGNALQLVGITNILQRNDYDTSFYPTLDKSVKINDALALANGIALDKSYGPLDLYTVDKPLPFIYSPKLLVKSNSADLFNVFQRFQPSQNIALVGEKANLPDNTYNNYRSLFYNYDNVTTSKENISEKLTVQPGQGSTQLTLDNPDSLLNLRDGAGFTFESGSHPKTVVQTSAKLENESPEKSFGLSDNIVTSPPLSKDRVYEVGDCRKQADKPDLHADPVIDVNEPAVSLSADRDMACVSFSTGKIEQGKEYLLQVDYRVAQGGYFGYCLSYNGELCNQTEIIDANNSDWNTYNVIFKTDKQEDFKRSRVYIYAPALYGSKSSVNYRLPRVREVLKKPEIQVKSDHVGEVNVSSKIELGGTEIVPDNDFSKKQWESQNRSCALVLDNSTYNTSQRQEDGHEVLRLEAVNTTACSSSPRFEIENSSAHVVSIEARVIKGGSWAYCIYSGRSCISKKSIEASDNEWHKYYFLFDGLPSERGLNLYLYSSQETNDSVVDFRDTSIRTVLSHSLPRFSTTNQEQKTVDVLGVNNISKLTSSDYKMNVSLPRNGSGVLVFQQSFSPAWHLNIGGYTVTEGSHFTANSYANGWLVNAKDICQHVTCSGSGDTLSFDATMSFAPQKYGRIATLISVGVTALVGVAIASLTLLPLWRKHKARK